MCISRDPFRFAIWIATDDNVTLLGCGIGGTPEKFYFWFVYFLAFPQNKAFVLLICLIKYFISFTNYLIKSL